MSSIAIVGAQWGDEGKGKIVDMLAEKVDMVVRYSGGDNAGHTVINRLGEFRLHLIPSGIFYPQKICVIGNGVVINPAVLLQEMEQLSGRGIDLSRLIISDRAHLIMPYHILLDGLDEDALGGKSLGTTRRGVGPAFTDKAARLGIRLAELLDKKQFRERLNQILDLKNLLLSKVYGVEPLALESVFKQYHAYGERLAPYVRETTGIIGAALKSGQKVMFEGAQGSLLDPDFGTYPYCTSSSPMAGNASLGSGIGPGRIDHVLGVVKAYSTRVGAGPMPTELLDELGEEIRQRAQEFGTTTGRPRRCGWFDGVAAEFSSRINGFDGLAVTRLDVLDCFPRLKVCVGYELGGAPACGFPADLKKLEKCRPVYEEMDGWVTPTGEIRRYSQLPLAARRYLKKLEEVCDCPVKMVSVGPRREETILRGQVI
jgi:adenylosuccinate synthase